MIPTAYNYLLFLLFGFAAADDCWAPIMPSKDGCSPCSDSELRGRQCVRSDRWFGCSASIESCCKYPEVASLVNYDTCIHKSGGQDNSLCKKVVSKSAAHNNDYCFEKCLALAKQGVDVQKDDEFNQECMYQHYEVLNGRTEVDTTCFEKWIYGHSEPNDKASYKPGLITETPAMCQLLCQQDPKCLNWIWASDIYNDSGNQDVKHRCDLKNEEMLMGAAEIKFTSNGPTNMDYKYCNSGLSYMCTGGGYRCLPCGSDDIPSCIWESDMHVSGWRHCTPNPICDKNVPTGAPPLVTVTTTIAITEITSNSGSITAQDNTIEPSTSKPITALPTTIATEGTTTEHFTTEMTTTNRSTILPITEEPEDTTAERTPSKPNTTENTTTNMATASEGTTGDITASDSTAPIATPTDDKTTELDPTQDIIDTMTVPATTTQEHTKSGHAPTKATATGSEKTETSTTTGLPPIQPIHRRFWA